VVTTDHGEMLGDHTIFASASPTKVRPILPY
jgi:hypothetical protein